MAEAPDADQKTQAPTAKRKRDAADKGDVLQSRELATALMMLAGVGWMMLAGPWFVTSLRALLKTGLRLDRRNIEHFDAPNAVLAQVGSAMVPLAVLFAATLVAAVAGPAVLGSLGFRTKAFGPDFKRLSPASGLQRMFGTQGVVELVKSLGKVIVLGAIGWWLVADALTRIMGLAALDPQAAAGEIGALFVRISIGMAAGLLVIGMIDAPVQIFRRLARLRMTQHEVKEESKESEGSPETKMMARQRRHEILNGSARRAVTEATVILTNPTHFAIALRYRPGIDAVPTVVARGRGETALAIKVLASEASVPQLEYPQLTRAIYFTTRAGQPIASDLYLAVATILAFVFNLDRAVAKGLAQPVVAVPPEKTFDERGRRQS